MKHIHVHAKSRARVRSFPDDVKYKIGRALYLLQTGEVLQMPLCRPMPIVGKGVYELRIRGTDGIYRVFFIAKSSEGIFVFHAFVKKTQKTPPLEIELARARLKEYRNAKI